MPEPPPPNLWDQLFEHTPVLVRVALGFLTFGIFTLLGVLWRWSREDLRRMEKKHEDLERRIDKRLARIDSRLWELMGYHAGGYRQDGQDGRDDCDS